MPWSVRIFWWSSLAIVAYWVFRLTSFLLFPPQHHLEALAKLPLELRADAHWADIFYPLVSTSIWSLATLTLAWLAAFRHKNWARWGFAVLLLFYNFLPALISLAYGQYHQLADFLSDVAQLEFVVPALSIAAVVSIFSKGSQAWFAH